MGHRLIEVPGARVGRWVDGFAERHGEPAASATVDALTLAAPDGAVARLDVPFGPADAPLQLTELAARTTLARDALVLLVRRGGVAVGVARDGTLAAHRCQTKYVQSRTAAGGWSQQRYARRRAGQTNTLVEAAVRAAVEVLVPQLEGSTGLVIGGDRALLADVLAEPRLSGVAALPRSALLDVKDPRLAVLEEAVRRAAAVRIHLDEPV